MKVLKAYGILRDNRFLFKTNQQETKELNSKRLRTYPNIPIYNNLWDNPENALELKEFLQELFHGNPLINKMAKKEIHLLIPDDSQFLEQRALEEFFMQFINKGSIATSLECYHLNTKNKNYISIAKTIRMFVMTYIKDGEVKEQRFLDKIDYSIEEMKKNIKNLYGETTNSNLPIYFNGNQLENYSDLGMVIDYKKILDNFIIAPTPLTKAPRI